MPTKPLVIVTRKLPDVIETRMMELFDVRLNLDDRPPTQADLVEAVRTAVVLVPTVTDHIDAAILSQAGPQLKLIANFGAAGIAVHTPTKTELQAFASATLATHKKFTDKYGTAFYKSITKHI